MGGGAELDMRRRATTLFRNWRGNRGKDIVFVRNIGKTHSTRTSMVALFVSSQLQLLCLLDHSPCIFELLAE
ncbi:hypothetical protein BDZ94DRAFT_1267522 [Collybia nuda]|uniref:Uncharacterized protein n=1 Tax=Collybia nuda TaxID=64659 RepID=A0A9P5XY15_9AGAR|nr:hypothetical protein BDZ94DRAFT_1267522 [Collybia nuda]